MGCAPPKGAIEEVWINGETLEPNYRVIGGAKPRGICGSGLISLLAEMFMTGVVDKAGNLNTHLEIPRIREGEHGLEYVIAWGAEDRAQAAISSSRMSISIICSAPKAQSTPGIRVLADSVGVPMEMDRADADRWFVW